MKIALIGPGIMPIPPDNWGAVESLMWDYTEYLAAAGVEVDLINTPDLKMVADRINGGDHDFVHLHYDDHARFLTTAITKPFCTTTHYGYIKEHYGRYGGWQSIFDGVMKSPGLISLTPEITDLYRAAGFTGFIRTLRNGARVKDFEFRTVASKEALCLGKIEPRKQQAGLAAHCRQAHLPIEFVGPVIDGRFQRGDCVTYGGVWTKPMLYSKMTDYKCLVLLSDGEAAPLVVPEALAAGLSVVVSETAAGNLDRTLPFIHVVPNGSLDAGDVIGRACAENHIHRTDIRAYAEHHFDWSVIVQEYLAIVREFSK